MTLGTANTAKTKAKAEGKYRPQLTATQITQALNLAKLDLGNPASITQSESLSLISTLAPFKAKIDNLAITPSYQPAPPKASVESSLGMDSPTSASANSHLTKEQQWEQSYKRFISNPSACTAEVIIQANEHAYLHDLMTTEQEEAYEQGLAGQASTSLADCGGNC